METAPDLLGLPFEAHSVPGRAFDHSETTICNGERAAKATDVGLQPILQEAVREHRPCLAVCDERIAEVGERQAHSATLAEIIEIDEGDPAQRLSLAIDHERRPYREAIGAFEHLRPTGRVEDAAGSATNQGGPAGIRCRIHNFDAEGAFGGARQKREHQLSPADTRAWLRYPYRARSGHVSAFTVIASRSSRPARHRSSGPRVTGPVAKRTSLPNTE